MTNKLIQHLTNPTKNKIIIQVMSEGQTTAKALAAHNADIPQATLYRHLKKLVDDGVLKIIEERQIRNVTEKVYGMAIDFTAYTEKMIKENDAEAYLGLFYNYMAGLVKEFKTYSERDDVDLLHDGSGFKLQHFYADLEELQMLSKAIAELITPFITDDGSKPRKERLLGIIFTPPTQ